MNVPALTLSLLAIGFAGWSAADVGMAPGDQLQWASTEAVSAAAVPFDPQTCPSDMQIRVVLRAPQFDPTGMAELDHARIEQALVEEWIGRMTAAGVPQDLLDRTLRMPNRTYELSDNDRARAGCIDA